MTWARVHAASDAAEHVSTLRVFQARESRFVSTVLSFGGPLVRTALEVHLEEPGATCELNGLYAVRGSEHVDNQTRVRHAAPECTSRQTYKGILDGRARAVFAGRVLVARDNFTVDFNSDAPLSQA